MYRFFFRILLIFVLLGQPAFAQSGVAPACGHTGDCQLNDAVNTLISIVEFLLGISGSLALLMFVYGGFVWVMSGGSEEKITKGKTIVRNAVTGLIIVFLAFGVISYTLEKFGISQEFLLLKGTKSEKVK